MIKSVSKGFIVKIPKITQMYTGDKMLNIFNDGEKIVKTFVDTKTSKVIKKVIDYLA